MATATTTIERAAPPESGPRALLYRLRHGDEVAHLVTLIFAALILLITSMMIYELWVASHATRTAFGFNFFWTSEWDPVFEHFGAAPFIYGTLVTSILSLAIALPLGLAAAIFLANSATPSLF
jgi:phosphate transport system permease protein